MNAFAAGNGLPIRLVGNLSVDEFLLAGQAEVFGIVPDAAFEQLVGRPAASFAERPYRARVPPYHSRTAFPGRSTGPTRRTGPGSTD